MILASIPNYQITSEKQMNELWKSSYLNAYSLLSLNSLITEFLELATISSIVITFHFRMSLKKGEKFYTGAARVRTADLLRVKQT